MSVGGSFWLKNWAEINGHSGTNPHVGKYIGIYFAFGIGNAALVVLQTLILWIFCSIEVSHPPFAYVVHLHRKERRGCTRILVPSPMCMKGPVHFRLDQLYKRQGCLADMAVPIVTD